MPTYRIGPEDALYFEHRPPDAAAGATFVFFNALTGDAASWDAVIGPALRAQGHGTLLWNFRGQKGPFGTPDAIDAGRSAGYSHDAWAGSSGPWLRWLQRNS
jgi:hypothetical protein